MGCEVATRFEETISQVQDAWGCSLTSDGGTAAGYQTVGLACGATPDGRHSMSHLTDGSRSPMAGADKKGPTAVLNSAGKIPFMHTELFNQRFMPVFLEGENRESVCCLPQDVVSERHDSAHTVQCGR